MKTGGKKIAAPNSASNKQEADVRKLACVFLLCAALGPGCFSSKRGKALEEEVAQMKKQLRETEASSAAERERLIKAIQTSEQEVTNLEDLLKKVDRIAKGDLAKLGTDFEAQKRLVDALRVSVEEIQQRIDESQEAQKRMAADLARIAGVVDKPVPAAPTMPTDAAGLLAFGESKLKEGFFNDARKALRELLKSYASDKRAEDAQFLIGESYYNEKKYDDANREFSKVVESYGSGERVDDALYRLGLVSLQQGQCDFAEVYFGELSTKHKKSPFLKDAQKQVKDIPGLRKSGKCAA
jgi:TolA-binding protein